MCFVVLNQRGGLSEQIYLSCQRRPGDGARSVGYAATYKFPDLGYRPTQSHPQILFLTLIVNSLEVFQLILQFRKLGILLWAIATYRWPVTRTLC